MTYLGPILAKERGAQVTSACMILRLLLRYTYGEDESGANQPVSAHVYARFCRNHVYEGPRIRMVTYYLPSTLYTRFIFIRGIHSMKIRGSW